ncbi:MULTISPECIES: hypothetical protein [Streptomyces]|uniref:Uncharacterized protein n=1 Tax=Streptomyces eurythermus TaxID=42237 RepID=A0ABW6YWK4_9ACTN
MQARTWAPASAKARGQTLPAADMPMLPRSAMVDGRTDLGVMAAGQVAG